MIPDCEHAMCVALQTMEAVYIGGDLDDAYQTITHTEDEVRQVSHLLDLLWPYPILCSCIAFSSCCLTRIRHTSTWLQLAHV